MNSLTLDFGIFEYLYSRSTLFRFLTRMVFWYVLTNLVSHILTSTYIQNYSDNAGFNSWQLTVEHYSAWTGQERDMGPPKYSPFHSTDHAISYLLHY
jgi:hypothetical protein